MSRKRPVNAVALVLLGLIPALPLHADSGVHRDLDLNWATEAGLLAGGAGLWLCANRHEATSRPPDRNALDPTRIFPADRWARSFRSRTAVRVSDIGLWASALLPVTAIARYHDPSEQLEAGLIVFEGLWVTAAITHWVKTAVQRPRPDTYDLAVVSRDDPDAFRSFFSGHTSLAFAGAVMAGLLAENARHPESGLIWGAGLGTAAVTGLCRVAGGRHFPTDVLAGAAAGAGIAWAVTELHRSGVPSQRGCVDTRVSCQWRVTVPIILN